MSPQDLRSQMAATQLQSSYSQPVPSMVGAFERARLRAYLNGVQDPGIQSASSSFPGLVTPGNINLLDRPAIHNEDGSISTTRSFSFQDEDGNEVVIPQIADDGSRILTMPEAIQQYKRTGKHLGKFTNPDTADSFATWLHNQQVKHIDPQYLNPLSP